MKRLLILLFSILISFNSYGEWEEIAKGSSGSTFYIDSDTIKEYKGDVYYWDLTDFLKPNNLGEMSIKEYHQGDCGMNRYKTLSQIWYKQPMGRGSSESYNPPDEWSYPSPRTPGLIILNYVCDYVD